MAKKGIRWNCQPTITWFAAICMFSVVVILYTYIHHIPLFVRYARRQYNAAGLNAHNHADGKMRLVKRIESRAARKRRLQDELQKKLTDTLEKLQVWKRNITAAKYIRNEIDINNGTSFIFTKENSPAGREYYNSFQKSPVTIDEFKRELLPQSTPFSNMSSFNACAIVGNGGILKNSFCGREIDSHDFVMSELTANQKLYKGCWREDKPNHHRSF
ncbi:uncharacterized protein LOC100373774 [Saccoglossus kowalevskii]